MFDLALTLFQGDWAVVAPGYYAYRSTFSDDGLITVKAAVFKADGLNFLAGLKNKQLVGIAKIVYRLSDTVLSNSIRNIPLPLPNSRSLTVGGTGCQQLDNEVNQLLFEECELLVYTAGS